jgi:predicted small lipoprotein YifL
MKNIIKKISTLLLMITLIVSLSACGAKHEAVKPDKDPKKIVVDKNYTEDLKKESGVQAGQVYVQNGMAIGTMILKDSVSDADAKALANKYAKELKKTYKDMKVNVQVVKKGKNVANVTFEK